MKRIMFVDDEPHVLESMRDALRPYRHRWALVFAASGREALGRLSTAPFDVVVSDMRMPGMDGASLLAEIGERHPQTLRVVLSGYTEIPVAARAASVAHLFLAKPCTSRELMTTVERACGVRDLLNDSALLSAIGAMAPLPAVPAGFARLSGVHRNPATTQPDAAAIARTLAATTFEAFEPLDPVDGFDVGPWQGHSLLVARIATGLARHARFHEDVIVPSVLHDVGKLVLAARLPHALAACLAVAADEAAPLFLVEQRRCRVTHAEIGAYLLAVWGLPHGLVEAVAHHHRPARVPAAELTAATIVHVADALAHDVAPITGEPSPTVDEEHLASLGFTSRLPTWCALAAAEAAATGNQLSAASRSGGT